MRKAIRERLGREDEGFTLIELMVVVLIIAILLAIAIPTFLGAQKRAKDRAAQSNLRNAYTAAKTVFSDKQQWALVTTTEVQLAEPNLTVGTASSAAKNVIDMEVPASAGANDYAVFAVRSDNRTCFRILEVTAGTYQSQGPGTYYNTVLDQADCAAEAASLTWVGSF